MSMYCIYYNVHVLQVTPHATANILGTHVLRMDLWSPQSIIHMDTERNKVSADEMSTYLYVPRCSHNLDLPGEIYIILI
jgi:hypothetical protein